MASFGPSVRMRLRCGSFDSTYWRLAPTRDEGFEDRVVDADLVALAQQCLCQVDVGALSEVVAAGLEAQTEQGDPMPSPATTRSMASSIDNRLLAKAPESSGMSMLSRPCQIEEGSKILGEA